MHLCASSLVHILFNNGLAAFSDFMHRLEDCHCLEGSLGSVANSYITPSSCDTNITVTKHLALTSSLWFRSIWFSLPFMLMLWCWWPECWTACVDPLIKCPLSTIDIVFRYWFEFTKVNVFFVWSVLKRCWQYVAGKSWREDSTS